MISCFAIDMSHAIIYMKKNTLSVRIAGRNSFILLINKEDLNPEDGLHLNDANTVGT